MHQTMYARNSLQFRHARSPNAPESNMDHRMPHALVRRQMGPPPLNYRPQPVEIDPLSYRRIPDSVSAWEATACSVSSMGETNISLPSNLSFNKTATGSFDFVVRQPTHDAHAAWWNGYDSPWVPRGAVPEVIPDASSQARSYPPGHRRISHGPQFGIRNRSMNPSDSGSVRFTVPPSDSGYGTGLSHESASVKGSDVLDHSLENRSPIGRVQEYQPYSEIRPSNEPHELGSWGFPSSSARTNLPYRCDTCQKYVKTKSELKKHALRHTKPFYCPNDSCTRKEGFSTTNDLDRHVKCKHPSDLPDGRGSKVYQCPVPGCKSNGKIWPRLDNFKSHLRRIHNYQDDIAMDNHVQRATVDQRPTDDHFPQNSQDVVRIMDQITPIGDDPNNYVDGSWGNEPDWNVSSIASDQQEEMDPLREIHNQQPLVSDNGECLIGMDGAHLETVSLQDSSGALWKPEDTRECQKKEGKEGSAESTGDGMTSPITKPQGSLVGGSKSGNVPDRGKTSRHTTAALTDPCLRDAITAVLSIPSTIKDAGSKQEPQSPLVTDVGQPDSGHASAAQPCRTPCDSHFPIPAIGSAAFPEEPRLDYPYLSGLHEKDPSNQDEKFQLLLKAINDAGYVLKKDNRSHTGLGSNVDQSRSNVVKKRDVVACPRCTKFRGRPCELKKHMKRHERPYGCTFVKCNKSFGSKNDWKRHENSQHYQHESWRCDEKNNDGTSCSKVFFTADNARAHFTKVHKVSDEAIECKIAERRIGPNNRARFWCGFCAGVINLNQKGLDGWNERFNHIDDHFMGRNGCPRQAIGQWKQSDDLEVVQASPISPSESNSDSSSDSSSSSSRHSAHSADAHSLAEDVAVAGPKRKRSSNEEQDERPSKQAKHGKPTVRVVCCECSMDFNEKTTASCPQDNHRFCDQCQRQQV